MNSKRVAVQTANGMYELKNFVIDSDGDFLPVATGQNFESGQKPVFTESQIKSNGVPVLSQKTYDQAKENLIKLTNGNIPSELAKKSKTMNLENGRSPFAVAKTGNSTEVFRIEKASTLQSDRTFEIVVDNSIAGVTATQKIVLGDFSTIHRTLNTIAALVTGSISGTFGASSVDVLRTLTGTNPLKLKAIST